MTAAASLSQEFSCKIARMADTTAGMDIDSRHSVREDTKHSTKDMSKEEASFEEPSKTVYLCSEYLIHKTS